MVILGRRQIAGAHLGKRAVRLLGEVAFNPFIYLRFLSVVVLNQQNMNLSILHRAFTKKTS
jgi:hypothetical protein